MLKRRRTHGAFRGHITTERGAQSSYFPRTKRAFEEKSVFVNKEQQAEGIDCAEKAAKTRSTTEWRSALWFTKKNCTGFSPSVALQEVKKKKIH